MSTHVTTATNNLRSLLTNATERAEAQLRADAADLIDAGGDLADRAANLAARVAAIMVEAQRGEIEPDKAAEAVSRVKGRAVILIAAAEKRGKRAIAERYVDYQVEIAQLGIAALRIGLGMVTGVAKGAL